MTKIVYLTCGAVIAAFVCLLIVVESVKVVYKRMSIPKCSSTEYHSYGKWCPVYIGGYPTPIQERTCEKCGITVRYNGY